MDADDRLRIRWAAPMPDGRQVVLRHRKSGETRAEPITGDRCSVELDAGDLSPGKWTVAVEADGAESPLLTDDPGFSLDGLRTYADLPRDRAVRVVRAADGRVSLAVRNVAPHAEVEAVHPRDGEIKIVGRLAYAGPRPGESARLVAAARDGDATVSQDVRLDGTGFHGCLAVDAFAAAEPALWDLWLDVGDVHARLATKLDDAPGKRGKLSYPRQVAAHDGREIAVRPYYTDRDQLAISASPVEDAP
ncbi:hypothetical protein [Actinomadura sp. BRA 177]|uniref:hypothetical protein n=1 Tax=Actinomadura sp. BRA 177 TaxID=2745202 RepID=UPI0015950015|nr:hypothetical protein [Actinomadura sp. BRA 177]NVI89187.1 hypothetical protein [Actinomadura sp. BRA 177]